MIYSNECDLPVSHPFGVEWLVSYPAISLVFFPVTVPHGRWLPEGPSVHCWPEQGLVQRDSL